MAVGALAGAAARSTAATTYVAVAGRLLHRTALDVAAALDEGDLDRARAILPALAGRDPSALDEPELSRAVVESVAENTVDAVVAPALWAAVLGGAGALGYRAVNTLDAMVGHRSDRYRRYGWASARLDDVANWLPARATAALVAAVRPGRAPSVWRAVRHDAPAHPSPNAGVAEAAFAAALGLRLGGVNRYGDQIEQRAPLGRGRPAHHDDIHRAVRLSRDVSLALAGGLACLRDSANPADTVGDRWRGLNYRRPGCVTTLASASSPPPTTCSATTAPEPSASTGSSPRRAWPR